MDSYRTLGGGSIDGYFGKNPDWSKIKVKTGRTIWSSYDDNTLQAWLVEDTNAGGVLLAGGNYANPIQIAGNGLPRIAGYFVDGFVFENPNQVGIDASGNSWQYVGTSPLPYTVTAGTDPNASSDYEKVFESTASNVNKSNSLFGSSNVGSEIDRLNSTKYGVFKSPANLGHVIGDFIYKKISPTEAELVTDISKHFPKGFDCTIDDYEEKGLKAYFVSQGATGTGSTLSDPMGSIADAIAKPDVDVIFVINGVYGIRSNFNSATPARDVIIKSLYGEATITTIDENGVWSDNLDGTYTHTLPSGSVNEVYDLEDTVSVDDLGYLIKLSKVGTLSECQATEGTWFSSGSTAVVHRRSANVPTNDTVYCLRSSPIGFRNFSTKVYFEGFKTFGGQNGGMAIENATGVYKGVNNTYLYGTGTNGDSFNAYGSYLVINEKCLAAAAEKDGFNYHNDSNRETHAIEINCKGIGNRKFGTGNGSTGHEACVVLRFGCDYALNNGPGVADISNVKCLNVCCTSNSNRNDQNSKGWLFTENVEAWCDSIYGYDNRTADIETQNSATLHIRDSKLGVVNIISFADSDFS